ncbi:hypothetical protein DL769_004297 [Monosporascus sp. CRB-8-3]|nr:hypothetical protein DL769_004297 [Monosporascus sp. CRB-8-3]
MQKIDRRHLLISVVVFFGVTVLVPELAHLELLKTVSRVAQEAVSTQPQFCTIWPVGDDGQPYALILHRQNKTSVSDTIAPHGCWRKPRGIKIVGWTFYGRRRNVDVLDCFLLQNLAANGGYLDNMRFIHNYFGVIHPLIPDLRATPSFAPAETWRQSKKPFVSHSNCSEPEGEETIFPKTPYSGHTWLLLSNDSYDLLKTPMRISLQSDSGGASNAFGATRRSWTNAAQQHYLVLINLERSEISRYLFSSPIRYSEGKISNKSSNNQMGSPSLPGAEQLYDTQYIRYKLNFTAIRCDDVKAALPIQADDEQHVTGTAPKRLKKPFEIDTQAVVAHLSTFTQFEGIKNGPPRQVPGICERERVQSR